MIRVNPCVHVRVDGANGDTYRRNIVLIKSLNDTIVLTLWRNLVTNE